MKTQLKLDTRDRHKNRGINENSSSLIEKKENYLNESLSIFSR